jgi:hypothetical protein
VRIVVQGAGAPALEVLELDGNFGISDGLLAALCGLFPGLQALTLVLLGRQPLTQAGFAHVARLRGLRALAVRDLRDGACVPVLAQSCVRPLAPLAARLRSLRLSTPELLARELQPACFQLFARLRELQLAGCQEQAEAALAGDLPLCCMRPRAGWVGRGAQLVAAA